MTYDEWYARVNRHVLRIAGVGIDDLPDGCSRDAYDDDTPPHEYAEQTLAHDGIPPEGFPRTSPHHVPAPPPTRGFNAGPAGEYYTETIVLENGTTVLVERKHASNGYVRVLS